MYKIETVEILTGKELEIEKKALQTLILKDGFTMAKYYSLVGTESANVVKMKQDYLRYVEDAKHVIHSPISFRQFLIDDILAAPEEYQNISLLLKSVVLDTMEDL